MTKSKLCSSLEKRRFYPYYNYQTKEEMDQSANKLIKEGYTIVKVKNTHDFTLYCKKRMV